MPVGRDSKLKALPAAVAIAFAMAVCLILLQPAEWRRIRNPYGSEARSDRQLIRDGKEIKEHTEFVAMLKRELGINRPVSILKGPYMFVGFGKWVESIMRYYILVDDGFWEDASAIEQKALLAHEAGHFIYHPFRFKSDDRSPSKYLELQIGADMIAARYTSPEAMIAVLNELRYRVMPVSKNGELEYDKRIKSLEKLKQGR